MKGNWFLSHKWKPVFVVVTGGDWCFVSCVESSILCLEWKLVFVPNSFCFMIVTSFYVTNGNLILYHKWKPVIFHEWKSVFASDVETVFVCIE